MTMNSPQICSLIIIELRWQLLRLIVAVPINYKSASLDPDDIVNLIVKTYYHRLRTSLFDSKGESVVNSDILRCIYLCDRL